jgi:hypothetical protein
MSGIAYINGWPYLVDWTAIDRQAAREADMIARRRAAAVGGTTEFRPATCTPRPKSRPMGGGTAEMAGFYRAAAGQFSAKRRAPRDATW